MPAKRSAKCWAPIFNGRQPDRVIFTSGGTEANNLAIFGLALANGTEPGEIISSTIEHPSVQGPLAHLESLGWVVRRGRRKSRWRCAARSVRVADQ